MAIIASYLLYDDSDLYKPQRLFQAIDFMESDQAILLHASFDPVSGKLEKLIKPENLQIYNLYGNRHEDEKAIAVSNRMFPPSDREVTVNPSSLPNEAKSVDYIFAITSLHEILTHKERVQFFKEARRLLKDDGTLIIVEQVRNLMNFIFFNIGAFHFVTLQDWETAIAEGGLKIVKRDGITLWGTVLYVTKDEL